MEKIKKTSDAKKGGLFVGKSHDEGGIPAIVVDTGQPIEVEGGEAIINKKATAKHWKELSKINQSTGGVPIPAPDRADELLDKFEKGGKLTILEKKTIHSKWKRLVNMTYSQLKKYYDSKDGKSSGLTQKEADDLGIDSGRESAVWIMKMKRTNYKDWTPEMWRWAKKQISFVSRMRGNKGELMENGKRTPKLKSLLIWGHNPYKFEGGGDIPKESKFPVDANSLQVMLKYASKDEVEEIQEALDAQKKEYKEKYKKKKQERYSKGGKMPEKASDIAFAIRGAETLLKYADESEKADIETYIKGLQILDKMSPDETPAKNENLVFKDKKYDITYSVEQRPDGRWTVYAESSNFAKNDQYAPSGLASKEDAIDLAKLSAGITKEEDPEALFMRNEFKAGGSVKDVQLLAPNGKPSNLTPEQYKLVRTPEFKNWFGDWEKDSQNASKVVDENGEPLVVYHGTPSQFFEFKKTENSRWETFWFTPRLDTAQMYSKRNGQPGNVLECFLNIKKPSTKYPFETSEFDGFIEYKNEMDYSNFTQTKKIEVIQIVNSKQIKLADGTNITFDSMNTDIRYANGGSVIDNVLLAPNGNPSKLTPEQYKLVRTPEFKSWFGDWENLYLTKVNDSGIDEVSLKKIQDSVSKVVDSNGEPMVVWHTTDKEFFVFDIKKSKEGFFFAPQKERLSVYNKSKLLPFFLNIKNPSHEMFTLKLDYLKERGYDGIMDYGHSKKINESLYEIIAFYPEQIKLADGSNTTFDVNNPDIRFKRGGVSEVLTYKEKYNKKYGYSLNESHSLEEISKDTGVSMKGLQEIYNKGVGAYRTNPESVRPNVKSPEQWAMARVYSAVMGGKTARIDAKELKMENGGKLDEKDKVTIDVPLLIRILELSREDIKSDAELHQMVERILDLKNKSTLTMEDYDFISKLKEKGSKYSNGGSVQNNMIVIESPIEMLDEINYNAQFKN